MTLILVLALVICAGALSHGLLFQVLAERTAVTHQETSQLALDAAETGIVRAEVEIRGMVDPDGDGIGTISGTHGGGAYTVTATQGSTSEERWSLVAVGTSGLSTRRVEVGLRRRTHASNVEGLYSYETLDFGGSSESDAYDSREGPYPDQAVNVAAGGTYARTGGHIGSGRDIVLHGSSSTIRGNAVPGPLHEVQMNGSPVVWGDILPRLREIDLPHTPYSDFHAAYLSNNNDTLLATNALGLVESVDMDSVSNPDLSALPGTTIDSFEGFNVMAVADGALDPMSYDQLLTEAYVEDLPVDATTLLTPSGLGREYYDKLRLDSQSLPIDSDAISLGSGQEAIAPDDGASDPSDPSAEPSDEPESEPGESPGDGGSAAAHPGRVSYNPDTCELRATAGAAVVLEGGTYFFSNIRLVGRAYLVVRGPTTIYVTGELDLGGGAILNESARPSDLRVFAHPYPIPPNNPSDSSSVRIRGGGDVAAVIYGPEADVTIGGGDDLYGSVVGRQITVSGSVRFHYDAALGVSSGRGATLERLYWRELSVPPR